MERKKYLIVFLLMLISNLSVATERQQIYNAFISGNMARWRMVIDAMHNQRPLSNSRMLELVNYQYGFVAWAIGSSNLNLARVYIEKAEEILDALENNNFNLSRVYAYKSAFYGFRIGLNRARAPFLGPRSMDYARRSISTNPNEPSGYIQYANAMYYMPPIFGGSKSVALDNYQRAIALMERNSDALKNDWNYINLLTTVANIYKEMGDYDAAKSYYQKILNIEPNFVWVKEQLYPELLNRMR